MARRRPASSQAKIASLTAAARREGSGRPPASRADYVHLALRNEIASGILRPGTPLVQDEVAARLGVSITPVREALRRLEAAGFVTYEAHYGATVSTLSDDAVSELYLLRSVVEGLAARLAASRVTLEEIQQLEQIQQEMIEMGLQQDVTGLADGSRRFHSLIADIGGPAYLSKHLRLIWESSPIPTEQSIWTHKDLSTHLLAAHADLIQALREGSADAAELLMSGHVIDVIELRLQLNKYEPESTGRSVMEY